MKFEETVVQDQKQHFEMTHDTVRSATRKVNLAEFKPNPHAPKPFDLWRKKGCAKRRLEKSDSRIIDQKYCISHKKCPVLIAKKKIIN